MSSESDCRCRCHLGGAFVACDVDAGTSGVPNVAYCGPHATGTTPSSDEAGRNRVGRYPSDRTSDSGPQNRPQGRDVVCEDCGAVAGSDTLGVHAWQDGDCILPAHDYRRAHPPRATVGHICRGCVERLRDWLGEITDLYATLPDVIPPGSVPDNTARHKHTKQPASPAPMRLDAWAMIHDRYRLYRTGEQSDLPDVPAVIADLAYRVGDDLGIEPGQDLGDSLTAAVGFLTGRLELVAASAWIDELDAELRWVRRQLRQAHGNPQPIGRCISVVNGRDCGGQVWPSKRQHDLRPECNRCHRRYDDRDLARLTLVEDREARREQRTGTDDAHRRLLHAADGTGRA